MEVTKAKKRPKQPKEEIKVSYECQHDREQTEIVKISDLNEDRNIAHKKNVAHYMLS